MIENMLEARKLPHLLMGRDGKMITDRAQWPARRQEIMDLLAGEVYGCTPPTPAEIHAAVEEEQRAFGGKAMQRRIRISFDTPGGVYSFPYTLLTPRDAQKAPAFVSVNFKPDIPHAYLPAEEIIDRGFALAALYYQDVTSDNAQMDGIAAMYLVDENCGWGKIGMWAFAASRVMDDLQHRPEIDEKRVCITGHSRLGKTALWCGAQDERFSMVISNASGCSGAALARGNKGERVKNITDVFPFWFCGNYRKWADKEAEMPFDQHMLLALTAPRKLYVSSADEDAWADPENEFLSCVAAGPAWKLLGGSGFITENEMPGTDMPLHQGDIGHHIRKGTHFYSRTDWGYQMAFREKHGV